MGNFIHIPFFYIWIAAVIFLIFAARTEKTRRFLFLFGIAVILTGAAYITDAAKIAPGDIASISTGRPEKILLKGFVASDPAEDTTHYGQGVLKFISDAQNVKRGDEWYEVGGLVEVTIYEPREAIHYGDTIALEGEIDRPSSARNPGGFDRADYLAGKGVYSIFRSGEQDAAIILKRGAGNPFIRFAYCIKKKIKKSIVNFCKGDDASLLSAMLLGERDTLSWRLKDLFIKTGSMHILAISGLHVGFIAALFLFLFRAIHIPRKIALIITIITLWFYVPIAGGRVSVLRAVIMFTILIVGYLLERDRDIYNTLGIAATLILICWPRQAFAAGFQLSFLAVLSIVYLGPRIKGSIYSLLGIKADPRPKRRSGHTKKTIDIAAKSISASIAVWFGLAPLVAFHFNIVTPVAIWSNLFVIPMAFGIVSSGFFMVLFGPLSNIAGSLFGSLAHYLIAALTSGIGILSKMPVAYMRGIKIDIVVLSVYYLMLFVILNRNRLKLSLSRALLMGLVIVNIFIYKGIFFPQVTDEMVITLLDVGHGDSIFIEFPGGGNMLIDGGFGSADGDGRGRYDLLPFLWSRGVSRVDAILMTHPDRDHMGGLLPVIENFDVGTIFDNGLKGRGKTFESYLRLIDSRSIEHRVVKRGDRIEGFDDVQIEILHPSKSSLANRELSNNDNSVIMRFEFGEFEMLFCADIGKHGLGYLFARKETIQADLIKMSHHGSYLDGAVGVLIDVARPEIAVISGPSVGRGRLPSRETLAILDLKGIRYYNTGDAGAVTIKTDGKRCSINGMIQTERKEVSIDGLSG
ncbi:MAG: DNA internalization-related competence protein ComEC/Rec2 [Candidatus Omnitrophica bacterium]|nr:DNA internalization-related competence protein ComEC/Rec2 [Candidatus Omnitrophota bacterium]